jgi:hypothetical protein
MALASGVTGTAPNENYARTFAKIRNAPYGRHLDRRSIEQLWLDEQKTIEEHDLSDAASEYE